MQNLKSNLIIKTKTEWFLTGFFILMSIMACSFTGIFLPAFFKDREIRNTKYYEVVNVTIDKNEYKAGEGMVITLKRNSLQDLELNTLRELNLVKADGLEEVFTQRTQSIAEQGSYLVSSVWVLPEIKSDGSKLEPGTYFWQADIAYRVDNINKYELIRTPSFTIIP